MPAYTNIAPNFPQFTYLLTLCLCEFAILGYKQAGEQEVVQEVRGWMRFVYASVKLLNCECGGHQSDCS